VIKLNTLLQKLRQQATEKRINKNNLRIDFNFNFWSCLMDKKENLNKLREISVTEGDWSREEFIKWWTPSKQLLKSIREYQKLRSQSVTSYAKFDIFAKILTKWYVLKHRFWSVVTGADIPLNCQIGGGLVLPHPNGVVIHPSAKIGINCTIFQQVTIVNKVEIGCHVDIGAGAKILKHVTIGNHAKVGANAVLKNINVPEKATAVGIPARIILPNN
jgi:serine O-acetyltransferase